MANTTIKNQVEKSEESVEKKQDGQQNHQPDINDQSSSTDQRLRVLKTYKIYIGGQFPRTESGRYYVALNTKGDHLANVCLSSRKDFREAVVAARSAFGSWGARAAFNRGQILYRIAEMLEGRRAQFIDELVQQDATKEAAE